MQDSQREWRPLPLSSFSIFTPRLPLSIVQLSALWRKSVGISRVFLYTFLSKSREDISPTFPRVSPANKSFIPQQALFFSMKTFSSLTLLPVRLYTYDIGVCALLWVQYVMIVRVLLFLWERCEYVFLLEK